MKSQQPGIRSVIWGSLMFALGAIFYCYESLLRVSPSVMSTELMLHYGMGAAVLGHLVAFYYYIYDPLQILVGMLMDKYGPRKLLTLAAFACGVGTYWFVATSSLHVAQIGRFLVGFGSAFAFVGVLKIATLWLPPERFAVLSGATMALGMLGGVFGDTGLTALIRQLGWRQASMYAAVMGVVLSVVLWLVLRDGSRQSDQPVEALTFPELLSNLKRLLQNRHIWLNGAIGCLLWFHIAIFAEQWGISYLIDVMGFTKVQAASANAMIFFGMAVGGPVMGMVSDRIASRRLPISVGSTLGAVLFTMLILLPDLSYRMVSAILFLTGFCCSAQVIVFPISRELSGDRMAGTALALTNMFVMLSGVLQPIAGLLLDAVCGSAHIGGVHSYPAHAYHLALSIIPASMVLTLILSFLLKETHVEATPSWH